MKSKAWYPHKIKERGGLHARMPRRKQTQGKGHMKLEAEKVVRQVQSKDPQGFPATPEAGTES